MTVDAEHVDPRDTRWEVDESAYRVSFWRRASENREAGWTSEQWRLSGADAPDVLAWAQERAQGRLITIWVEYVSSNNGLGVIRLQGWEPNRDDNPPPHLG